MAREQSSHVDSSPQPSSRSLSRLLERCNGKFWLANKKGNKKSKTSATRKTSTRIRSVESVANHPFWDFTLSGVNVTGTPAQYSILDPLLSASGLMQQFPQHAKPFNRGGTFGLRQFLRIVRFEVVYQVIGSQSNAILSSDIYNTVRVAMSRSGISYQIVNQALLTSVIGPVNTNEISHIYFDNIHSLMTNAWNASSGYNSPGVMNKRININNPFVLECRSGNTSGVGVAWETNGNDFVIDLVSDSSLSPHPLVNMNIRVYFMYL